MGKYAHLKKHQIQEITHQYGLTVVDFEYIDGGATNFSYYLRAKNSARVRDYVVTIFDIAPECVVKVGRVLRLLEGHQFPTTRLLHTIEGSLTTPYLDRKVIVKAYISGQVRKDLDEGMLFQIGEAMGRLNLIPPPDFLAREHAYGIQTFHTVLGKNNGLDYETWLAGRLAYLGRNIPPGLPRGLIHGDVFYDNVLIEGKQLKAIIDFENVCWYHIIFELGMGIVGLCSPGTKVVLDKARALVSGYQRVRKLDDLEKESLQLFVEYAAIATSYWRFWKFHMDIPKTETEGTHWQMVQIAEDARSIPRERFLEAIFRDGI